jgi:hopene-associated glycosyltransferase HpnB
MGIWLIFLSLAALLIWAGMLLLRGGFWRARERLDETKSKSPKFSTVAAIVPARNEARTVSCALRALMQQNYPGTFSITLVDDGIDDDTASLARAESGGSRRLQVIAGKSLSEGWTGKLWVLKQGLDYAQSTLPDPQYFLLTDADTVLQPNVLGQLVTKAEIEELDLVSLMALLHCKGVWERLLMPAFVFFFQMVYPFSYVNDPKRSEAAAAGGCILVRASSLEGVGVIETIRGRLIDDCALAIALKRRGSIWLGLTDQVESLRVYGSFSEIWTTVARTAFEQLEFSALRLCATVVAMGVTFVVPLVTAIVGVITGDALLALFGSCGLLVMFIAYLPTIRLYRQHVLLVLTLPIAAFLFTLMTIESARCYWTGSGGQWKDRSYQQLLRN